MVTVTGAAGQIGYAILFQIAQGRMLGPDQPVELRLLEMSAEDGGEDERMYACHPPPTVCSP